MLQWGLTLQYSLQYLQSYVQDIGLPRPFSRMIPIVEFAMETPTQGRDAGRTTGTINPGIIWFGRYFQLGVEAVIPVNTAAREERGRAGELHFYLDDISPKIFTWTPFHGVLDPTQPRSPCGRRWHYWSWPRCGAGGIAGAHAFPDHSEPRVGHTLDASPPAVRIWFDGAIEPVFSTIPGRGPSQRRVDKATRAIESRGRHLARGRPASARLRALHRDLERGRPRRASHRRTIPLPGEMTCSSRV